MVGRSVRVSAVTNALHDLRRHAPLRELVPLAVVALGKHITVVVDACNDVLGGAVASSIDHLPGVLPEVNECPIPPVRVHLPHSRIPRLLCCCRLLSLRLCWECAVPHTTVGGVDAVQPLHESIALLRAATHARAVHRLVGPLVLLRTSPLARILRKSTLIRGTHCLTGLPVWRREHCAGYVRT